MKHLDFRERTTRQREDGMTLFPEHVAMPTEMELIGVGVDQATSDMGRTEVVLVFKTSPDTKLVRIVTMSAATYLTVAAAIKGAMERFGDPWKGA